MLCCAVLCCAVLCCALLCCAVLRCAALLCSALLRPAPLAAPRRAAPPRLRGRAARPCQPARATPVTGCGGRIGRAVANELTAAGWAVRGYDRAERPEALDAAVEYIVGDLTETDGLAIAVSGASAVVHLAACADDADFESALLPCNIVGVVNVLNACRAARVKRVVVASSGKVHYGHAGALPIRVTDPPSVVCNYGATKLFAEGACAAFARDTGARTVVIRFAWCPRTPDDIAAMRAARSSMSLPSSASSSASARSPGSIRPPGNTSAPPAKAIARARSTISNSGAGVASRKTTNVAAGIGSG